jgi:hypothetical protein
MSIFATPPTPQSTTEHAPAATARELIPAGTCPDHKTDLHILVIDGKPGSVRSGFCGCVYDANSTMKVYRW